MFFMLFLLLVLSQKCYRKSKQWRPQNCWLCHACRLNHGGPWPCAVQKETQLISTSTARLTASTTPEAHTSDMPLVWKSLEGRGLSESATSLILQSWRKGTKQQYKSFVTKWEQYRSQRKINPFSATIEHGINFLADWK